jgi:adenylate cyclase class 2
MQRLLHRSELHHHPVRCADYTDAMHGTEIELKFSVTDERKLREQVVALGFALVTERTFEENTLYDSPDRRLRAMRQILRLRRYGSRSTVTHKRSAGGDDKRYKSRIETESQVEDFDALEEIFVQLGYGPVFKYEKFRTEWETSEGHLVLDETPIGVWAELEGPPEWIDAMLERLGVGQESCTTDSYGKLFTTWKEQAQSPAENLTFEECAAVVKG